MKRLFFALLLVLLPGCGLIPFSTNSDFDPPKAMATNPQPEKSRPQDRILKIATSQDGISYTQTDRVITYQAHQPDILRKPNGDLFVYYTGWMVGDRLYRSAIATSNNKGRTWTYKYLEVDGSPNFSQPVDVDAVLLPDGTTRIYYTAHGADGLDGIHYAESSDGIRFTYKGVIFAPRGYVAEKPTVFEADGAWHLYALSDDEDYPVWHLTSDNGIQFEVYARTSFPIDEVAAEPSNGVWIDDQYHLFVAAEDNTVRSFSTKDGTDWNLDNGARLAPSGNEPFVEDVTVTQLKDGTYLMVYTTTE